MIDREKVIKGLMCCMNYYGDDNACRGCPYDFDDDEEGETGCLKGKLIPDAIALLKEREPKHGHWIDLQNCSNAGVYCSECHVKVFPYYPMKKKLSLFCPHCGAKMDGETVEFND